MAADRQVIEGVEMLWNGNQEGFNIIYSYTHDYVYKRARYIMQSEEDALDLMQETYTQVYKNIGSLESAENIYAWIGAIVYRQGMRIFRDRKEILVDEEAEAVFEDIVSEDMDTNPEESAEATATVDIVMGLIEELPELQRAAIIAFYYDNKKIDDIATEFGCSANTIKSRLNYAKKFLKDKVETHEKAHGYKLHTVGPVIILSALRAMFETEKYIISSELSKAVCENVLSASGAASVTGGVVTTTASATTVATTTATTATAAATVAVADAAAKVGMGIGIKLAIGVASVAIAATATIGVASFISDDESGTTPIVTTTVYVGENETTDNSITMEAGDEETTSEQSTEEVIEQVTEDLSADAFGWKELEGEYVHGYDEFDDSLVISNVMATSEDIGTVTFDIEYRGMPGQNVVINDRTVTFDVNHENGSISQVELLIWTGFEDNSDAGKLIELKRVTTITGDGMVADMNNVVPVVYSKMLAQQGDVSLQRRPVEDGKYETDETLVACKPEGYFYSVDIATTEYQGGYKERVVTIEIYGEGGQLVDTLESESFAYDGEAYCNFWARSTEGYLFVGHIDDANEEGKLIFNCHATMAEAPEWYEGANLFSYVKKTE